MLQMGPGSIGAISLGCILAVLLIVVGVSQISSEQKTTMKASAFHAVSSNAFMLIMPVILIALMITYFSIAGWYSHKYGQYRSTPGSIQKLLTIRRQVLSTTIQPLVQNTISVCSNILAKQGVYSKIAQNETALVNWRPMTVRIVGYLGGINSAYDGVFDMEMGVTLALAQGARAFVFDIDYLDDAPCAPVILHRDDQRVMRSLHTGSIRLACKALAEKAFMYNYDPVLVIVYLRRIPPTVSQQNLFFKAIASSLDPLTAYHLGSNEYGNFHNCRSESQLFASPITNYQKKFIVLTNYNTNILVPTPNPKDNLDFWTNARIYQDPSGLSSTLGSATPTVPTGQVAYVQVGAASQLLNIGSSDQANYVHGSTSASANTFKICLGAVDYTYTSSELNILMNILGCQCVPMDVVALSALPAHTTTITKHKAPATLNDLANPSNELDPLSYWINGGWSRKLIIGDKTDDSAPTPIQGFVIPSTVVPKAPSPSTNSNGGLVNIA